MDSSATTEAGAFEAALRELRDAVDLREAEHARRNSNRVLFSRAVSLFFVGVCFGLLVLTRAFDVDEFRQRLLGKLRSDAPLVIRKVGDQYAAMDHVYRTEAIHAAPALAERLDAAVGDQGSRLSKAAKALSSEGEAFSATADNRLASQLLERYGAELGHDSGRALALATALHVGEAKAGRLAEVRDVAAALRSASTPDADRDSGDLRGPPLIDAVHTIAVDNLKTRLISGESALPKGGH